jgi:hypothetical protein
MYHRNNQEIFSKCFVPDIVSSYHKSPFGGEQADYLFRHDVLGYTPLICGANSLHKNLYSSISQGPPWLREFEVEDLMPLSLGSFADISPHYYSPFLGSLPQSRV